MKQRFPTIREGHKCQARGRQVAFGPETESGTGWLGWRV